MADRPFFVIWIGRDGREGVSPAAFTELQAARDYAERGLRDTSDLAEAIVVQEHVRITAEEVRGG